MGAGSRTREQQCSQTKGSSTYTSAEVAMSILENKSVWMRRASTMNDFREIEHGFACVLNAWNNAIGNKYRDLLAEWEIDASKEIVPYFDQRLSQWRTDTFLTCVSEHDPSEDQMGRLSMWRAYGGQDAVAIVMNNTAFLRSSDALKAYTNKVNYLTVKQFEDHAARWVNHLHRYRTS